MGPSGPALHGKAGVFVHQATEDAAELRRSAFSERIGDLLFAGGLDQQEERAGLRPRYGQSIQFVHLDVHQGLIAALSPARLNPG